MIKRALIPLCVAALCSCARSPAPGLNVVLITIDTLRADHLSCYGYERATSPFIDTVAAQGTIFGNAYATSPWTSPSMASIFTSLYPRSHGVVHGFTRRSKIVNQELLSPEFATITEVLKEHGYETFGISTNGHMSPGTGFERGFDHYASLWFKKCPAPNRAALTWKDAIGKASPYFLWVHYIDPHAPYMAREPWIGEYNPDKSSYRPWSGVLMRKLRARKKELMDDPGAARALMDLYDSEINSNDEYLEELFENLGLMDNSLVIIAGDHGEGFLDHHNLIGHGNSLFDELVRVPLIVAMPGRERGEPVVERPVSIIDIYPTILEAAGIPVPDRIQGESLLPLIRGQAPQEQRPVYAELDRGRYQKAVRLGDWKYLCRGKRMKNCRLYDIGADPREENNLLNSAPDVAVRMRGVIDEWMAENPEFTAPKMQQAMEGERLEMLRSLGYLN